VEGRKRNGEEIKLGACLSSKVSDSKNESKYFPRIAQADAKKNVPEYG